MHKIYSILKGYIIFKFSFRCYETTFNGNGCGDGNNIMKGSGYGEGEDNRNGEGYCEGYGYGNGYEEIEDDIITICFFEEK